MPHDPNNPLSDLAQSIAEHDDPQDPGPTPSSTPSSTDSADNKADDKQKSISSHVQSAIWQAARMDSVGEGEQAKQDTRWQQTAPLQTIALDDHDLPPSTSSPQAGLLWYSYSEVAANVSSSCYDHPCCDCVMTPHNGHSHPFHPSSLHRTPRPPPPPTNCSNILRRWPYPLRPNAQ